MELTEHIKDIIVNNEEILDFPRLNNDSVVERVVESFYKRSDVGFKKYGTNLDRKDFNALQWINEAQQEAMDFVLYLEKLKEYYEQKDTGAESFAKN